MAGAIGFFIGTVLGSFVLYYAIRFVLKLFGKSHLPPYVIASIGLGIVTIIYANAKAHGSETADYWEAFLTYLLPMGIVWIVHSIKHETESIKRMSKPQLEQPELPITQIESSSNILLHELPLIIEHKKETEFEVLQKDFQKALEIEKIQNDLQPPVKVEILEKITEKTSAATLISDLDLIKIERLFELKSKGALTEEEFLKQKGIILKK